MSDWKPKMNRTVRVLGEQLASLRSGTVEPGLVSSVRTSKKRNSLPIGQLATVSRKGNELLVRPFDPIDVSEIVRALTASNLSAYAMDLTTIRVTVPPISGDQRQKIVSHVRSLGEEARVAIRLIRQDARKQIAAKGKGSERAVQEATDAAVAEVNRLVTGKVAEIEGG